MEMPSFQNKTERTKWLIENKQKLIDQKKMQIKHADALFIPMVVPTTKTQKASEDATEINVKVVINTTNILDSHSDVHVKGIWDKSIRERKNFYLLQEHKNTFDGVISEDVKAYVEEASFKQLGFNLDGSTQMLVFEATIKEDTNPKMFKRYKEGLVKEHSVGMQYVKLIFAINDEEAGAEFEAWEKYLPEIANKQDAIEKGFFWVVKEAKVLEGSAVLMGSNSITPTLEVKEFQPSQGTEKNIKNEPSLDTLITDDFINSFKI